VLVLERKQLTSGTTWHAAGLLRSALASYNLTRLATYTLDLYARLEAETGQTTGVVQPGSISIATNKERWESSFAASACCILSMSLPNRSAPTKRSRNGR